LKNYAEPGAEQKSPDDKSMRHLDLLIQHLEDEYRSTSEQLSLFLSRRKISFDLLWAFFKPGTLVYVTCPFTGLPRCIRYSFGEEKRSPKGHVFKIQGQYLDFDGEAFGESTEILSIDIFRRSRQIEDLPAYPLEYHPDPGIKSLLVSSGRKFVLLTGCYHRQYQGHLFVPHKDKLIKIHVNSRIMVDAGLFRELNPNYPRLEIKKPAVTDLCGWTVGSKTVGRIQGNGMDPMEIGDDDLAICSPTVLGFSLDEKIWGEFQLL
jgi:hypothetical protein